MADVEPVAVVEHVDARRDAGGDEVVHGVGDLVLSPGAELCRLYCVECLRWEDVDARVRDVAGRCAGGGLLHDALDLVSLELEGTIEVGVPLQPSDR